MSNKVVLVTGGAKGIGKAIALAYAKKGYDIALHYRGSYEASVVSAKECEAYGVKVSCYQCDLINHQAVEEMIKQVVLDFKKIDVVVNNAGKTRDNLILRMSIDEFSDVVDTNLKGTFYVSKAVAKQMFKQKYGHIINITSVIGVAGNVGQANYAASKAGIIGLTKSMAKELSSRNILVNAIAPGFIVTEMTANLSEDKQDQILQTIPMRKYGNVEDVANLAYFLGSDENCYINGQVIRIDGGMMI